MVLLFGMILYAVGGLRNLRDALVDALSSLNPEQPPKGLSKGSVSPARERMPVEVLRQAWRHVRSVVEQRPRRQLVAGLRVLCLDGTGFAVADTEANEQAYGRPGSARGKTGFPKLRSVLVMDAATHLFIEEAHGAFDRCSEAVLTDEVLERVVAVGVLLEADRGFYSFERAAAVLRLGGELLVRVRNNIKLPVLAELSDGSYLTMICSAVLSKSKKHRARREQQLHALNSEQLLEHSRAERIELLGAEAATLPASLIMRVVEYDVVQSDGKRNKTRLLSSIVDIEALPAAEASDGYHLRWQIELGIREIKWLCDEFRIPQLPGRSPASIEQDYASVLLAHSLLRATMLLAAEEHEQNPARLSLSGARAVLNRYIPRLSHVPVSHYEVWFSQMLREVARQRLPKPKNRVCPRAVKVKMSKWPTKTRSKAPPSAPSTTYLEFRSPCLVPA